MFTKLETMENQAKFIGSSFYNFTPFDWIEVFWHPEWEENADFEYRYNGVSVGNDRDYIAEKIPGYFEDGEFN